MVAGAGYVIDSVAYALLSNCTDFENLFLAIVAIPTIVGELWFALWLSMRRGSKQAVPVAT